MRLSRRQMIPVVIGIVFQAAVQEQIDSLSYPFIDFRFIGGRFQTELQFLKALAAQCAQELVGEKMRIHCGKIARLLMSGEKLREVIEGALWSLFVELSGEIREAQRLADEYGTYAHHVGPRDAVQKLLGKRS